MTTVYSANERGAIEDAVRLYIDGVSKGDADKLKTGFHSEWQSPETVETWLW
jgi:hypothetical protein